MGLLRIIKNARSRAHKSEEKKKERQITKTLLARNKAIKEADKKEKLAEAREELARARERKAAAQAKLDKDKKKTDWRKIGKDFFSHFGEPAPRRRAVKRVAKKTTTRKRAKRG